MLFRSHDAVGHVLVGAEGARLPEHGVDESRLAVVDMGDDGDIAEVFAASHLSTLRGGRALPEIGERAAMTFYADIPARRNRQILGDLWLVAWSALWIWAALRLHDLVMNLAAPGLALADGATSLSDSIANAGETVASVPMVGEGLSAPFTSMSDAALSIAAAGQSTADAVSLLARFLSIALAVLGIAAFAMFWIPIRVAFIRRATAARALVDANEDLDLFALRAMARQPLTALARISDDPAGAWRRGDRAVIDALAALELKSEGLRPPA